MCTTGIGLVISVLVQTQVAAMVVTAIATVVDDGDGVTIALFY